MTGSGRGKVMGALLFVVKGKAPGKSRGWEGVNYYEAL